MKTGIELIAAERQEQIEKHGRTIKHDVLVNTDCELSEASMVLCSPDCDPEDWDVNYYCPGGWDLEIFAKMMSKPYKERLIIAGALIAAEIDRLNAMESHE